MVFPALLPLAYVPELLGRTRQLFVSMFRGVLEELAAAMRGGDTKPLGLLEERLKGERWDMVFDRCLRDCEGRKEVKVEPEAAPPSAEEIAKNVHALKTRMRQKTASPSPRKSTASTAKLMRKWADSPVSAGDMAALDYSEQGGEIKVDTTGLVSADAMGSRTANGYEVAEWDFKLPSEEEILSRDTQGLTVKEEASTWSLFSRLAGRRAVTREDLAPVLGDMEKNLMDKNVAKDIAEKLCEAVGTALVGKKLGLTSKYGAGIRAESRRQERGPKRCLSGAHEGAHAQDVDGRSARHSTKACGIGRTEPVRHNFRRRERCGQVDESVQGRVLAVTEQTAGAHRGVRHLSKWCRGAAPGPCEKFGSSGRGDGHEQGGAVRERLWQRRCGYCQGCAGIR